MLKSLIKLIKDKPKDPPNESVATAHEQLGISYEAYRLQSTSVTRTEWFNRLVFPSSEGLNKYELLRYQSSVIKFIEWLEEYKSFDVTGLNAILDASKIKVADPVKDLYEALRCLHCVKFKNIPPDILEEMPMMINAVFSEGRTLNDITDKEELTDVKHIE